ncbi:TetR/AcrR family transcriptional regulator C-terminal domain-containing protein [Lentilactobacillus buchneri]|uniref:Transcriptional regulator TetR C-terminal Firmicutes type domain-containing protein n=2 Tax=Lentilactobacillus buchneri TaxID=1581 RepID=A0A4R5NHI8_LENBU|nr:TetR/AcrR family transcriptional regulator C-terminal domain-containing protein [Lentilactobacillus buchneri]WCJ52750.1 TetR/AcrR family transcriptional regulator C-terminal domain-containing protein [Lentilactobacillus sp. Egmn17]AEB72389.1 transcriptional regulator [Lentilactobacillus buchneri NRRL B-30929]MCT2881553.1 transcriptional regulator [Lentilactobacillus buchneri]MCT3252681.1 transcriptional regulator [Lentilactobacillus buchneri]MCT3547275.1 transcriptional regulator [Lentilact
MDSIAKHELSTSLEELVTKTSFDDVSVKLIVSNTSFNRQTFYYHFQDKFDCLQYTLSEFADKIASDMDYSNWQECYLRIFRYIDYHKEFMQHIVDSQAYSLFTDFVLQSIDLMLHGVLKSLQKDVSRNRMQEQPWKLFEYGLQGIIINWFTDGLRENPELLVNDLLNIDMPHLKMLLGVDTDRIDQTGHFVHSTSTI